jgi:hypothetical protein
MAKILSRLFNTKKSPLFWAYFVIGVVVTAVSVALMPFWQNTNVFFSDWGVKFTKIVIAVMVLAYTFLFLLKRILRRGGGVVKILSIIEFSVLILISLGLILSQFSVFALDASKILALAFWMRGTVEVFRAFYTARSGYKYPVSKLVLAIVLLSLGAYFFGAPFVTNEHVLWTATIFGTIFGVITFLLGFFKKP